MISSTSVRPAYAETASCGQAQQKLNRISKAGYQKKIKQTPLENLKSIVKN